MISRYPEIVVFIIFRFEYVEYMGVKGGIYIFFLNIFSSNLLGVYWKQKWIFCSIYDIWDFERYGKINCYLVNGNTVLFMEYKIQALEIRLELLRFQQDQ